MKQHHTGGVLDVSWLHMEYGEYTTSEVLNNFETGIDPSKYEWLASPHDKHIDDVVLEWLEAHTKVIRYAAGDNKTPTKFLIEEF